MNAKQTTIYTSHSTDPKLKSHENISTGSVIKHVHIQERYDISLSTLPKGYYLTLNICRVAEMQPEHENF